MGRALIDPVQFVLSLNLTRRHLNEIQRAMVADNISNMPRGGDREKRSANSHYGVST